MNGSNEQLREIELQQAWLSGLLDDYPEPAPRGLENLKLTVRIAAQEHLLDALAAPPPSPQVISDVKRAVRRELDVSQVGRGGSGWSWSRLMGGLAAAAAVAFWFLPAPVTNRGVSAVGENLFVEVLIDAADGEDELEGWSEQVRSVEAEMQNVADLLVSDDSEWGDYRLNDLDALDEQIDELYEQLETAVDT